MFQNKYTIYGKAHEKNAMGAYIKNNPGIQVCQAGFIICEKFPSLGYSPDGIVFENGVPVKLLEIKCPIAGALHF